MRAEIPDAVIRQLRKRAILLQTQNVRETRTKGMAIEETLKALGLWEKKKP